MLRSAPLLVFALAAAQVACATGSELAPGPRDDEGPAVVSIGSPDDDSATTALAPSEAPAAPATAAACAAPSAVCGGACVRLSDDAANCGACGRSCDGTACIAGRCAPSSVVTLAKGVADLDVARGIVFVSDGVTPAVLLPGTRTPVKLPDLGGITSGFRVVGGLVAFADAAAITTVDPAGGATQPLFSGRHAPRIAGFTLGLLDWVEAAPERGEGHERLLVGDVYWHDHGVVAESPEPIAFVSSVYYSTYFVTASGKVFRALRDTSPEGNAPPTVIAELDGAPAAFAATYGLVAWARGGEPYLRGLSTRTQEAYTSPRLAAAPRLLLSDEAAVYFTVEDPAGTTVYRVSPSEPTPRSMWTTTDRLTHLRADDRALYFATTAGTVWRLLK